MRRRKCPMIALFFSLLLIWALAHALIAAAENDQHDIGRKVTQSIESYVKAAGEVEIAPVVVVHPPGYAGVVSRNLVPELENYLRWKTTYPEGYVRLLQLGREYLQGTANYPLYAHDAAMVEAALIAYEGARWDCYIHLRGCASSPYYGRGAEIAKYLYSRGRAVANCLATLEVESTFRLGGTVDFGILYGNYPNTVEGYCDLLDDYGVSNDPNAQAWFWNSPGCPRYADGYCRVVHTIETFWP